MIQITVKKDKEKLQMTVEDDHAIEGWRYIFGAILSFLTFYPETIEELFNEEKMD